VRDPSTIPPWHRGSVHPPARVIAADGRGATLMAMKDTARWPAGDRGDEADVNDSAGRLAAYEARTNTALDLLALATLWIAVVPPGDFGTTDDVRNIVLVARTCLSLVYGIDLVIRSVLAGRRAHYALNHPLRVVTVVFPPARVIFSLRLFHAMFRRGNLSRFLVAAGVLVLNGAVIVYLFERHAPHSNIRTLGEAVWWAAATVTTVGYGDYTPVTAQGRVTACFIMGIGLTTLAVITAQVASSFVAQGVARARADREEAEPAAPEVTLAELEQRLARIEALLTATAGSPRTAPTAEPGGDPP
jgi:voltage-gated potassium channel